MAVDSFQDSLRFVLKWEGGFVNNPNDPGGATDKGVTQNVYDQWRRSHESPPRGVQQIDDDEVQAIYQANYWLPAGCDRIVTPLDLAQFDTAVNMGKSRAVRFLQQAVGAEADGAFGPATERCAAACDLGQALVAYCNSREACYKDLVANNAKLEVFLKGWLNRLDALRKQLGLPGYESAGDVVDYGDVNYMKRVPDPDAETGFE